jgi:hypothetical protein
MADRTFPSIKSELGFVSLSIRLFDSAKALAFKNVPTREEVRT